jgi:hypothetical protein
MDRKIAVIVCEDITAAIGAALDPIDFGFCGCRSTVEKHRLAVLLPFTAEISGIFGCYLVL